MNILIVSQYFWPENFKINEIAVFLKEKGHVVTVLTGQPNYPEGRFYDGYSFVKPKLELFNEIEVYRLPTIPRGNRNAVKLILNYLFFPISGRFLWKKLLKNKSFDVVFVCQLSPVFVGLLGARIKKSLNIPMVMWVLDLWPESVFAVSKLNFLFVERVLKAVVKSIYKSCDRILVSSKSFSNSIVKYGFSINKIHYFPNWSETETVSLTDDETKNLPHLPKGFTILFAGNIGEAHDIETILKSAEELSTNEEIKWIFIGDGRKRSWLEKEIILRKLEKSVFWLGRFPVSTMPYFYKNASVLLVSLIPNPVFELTVPAKLQSYMANKKVIISLLTGEGNRIVEEAKCGIPIKSGDNETLSLAVKDLFESSPEVLARMGENGYNYFIDNFEKYKVLNALDSILII